MPIKELPECRVLTFKDSRHVMRWHRDHIGTQLVSDESIDVNRTVSTDWTETRCVDIGQQDVGDDKRITVGE